MAKASTIAKGIGLVGLLAIESVVYNNFKQVNIEYESLMNNLSNRQHIDYEKDYDSYCNQKEKLDRYAGLLGITTGGCLSYIGFGFILTRHNKYKK